MRKRYPHIALDSSVVIVAGGAGGIGRATAALLHDIGAIVWIGDIDVAEAQAVAHDLGPGAFAYPLDVTSRQSWTELCAAVIERHERIDVLINNAGIMPAGGFLDGPDDEVIATFDINTLGLVLGMRAVLPLMVRQGRGHIINVASMAGKVPIPGLAVYNASKFAAVGLSAAVRAEFDRSGVSVSAVLPCGVRTSLSSGIPLGQGLPTVEPEDVARAIIRNCETRRAEVAVPGYAIVWDVVRAVVPEPVLRAAMRILRADRVLTAVDESQRITYRSRMRGHVRAVTRAGAGVRK
ncbi:SDR family NAD(P)-dependent oxidoreductase [Hoyosella sp. YIM 151337]|uniref:SDR family NAD(P)-dependent oxidoreductase n=1 Tax=Hoyosella sp. YIM 151337 TaxID=2992742 RepID=UPI0022369E61|nr:SDR family NAD(P)-dependent oxidoreductase [Hoyosella sp. YIM 151337]MCW4352247.1 SDR family NAD(P)-dependent oxidoreductase [Hoyosella sp. YIM 151337]